MLTDIDEELVQWLLHATPGGPHDEAQMKQVMSLRGTLDQLIEQTTLDRLKISAQSVANQVQQLTTINQHLSSLAKTVQTANDVISDATAVVGIATSIVAMV